LVRIFSKSTSTLLSVLSCLSMGGCYDPLHVSESFPPGQVSMARERKRALPPFLRPTLTCRSSMPCSLRIRGLADSNHGFIMRQQPNVSYPTELFAFLLSSHTFALIPLLSSSSLHCHLASHHDFCTEGSEEYSPENPQRCSFSFSTADTSYESKERWPSRCI